MGLVGRCNLSEMQKFWYKRLLLKDSEYLEELERKASSDGVDAGGTGSWRKLQALMMQLRKCCLHPYLFEDADLNPGYSDESLVEACGKLQVAYPLCSRTTLVLYQMYGLYRFWTCFLQSCTRRVIEWCCLVNTLKCLTF